jgi:hypothetical protein
VRGIEVGVDLLMALNSSGARLGTKRENLKCHLELLHLCKGSLKACINLSRVVACKEDDSSLRLIEKLSSTVNKVTVV